MFCLVGVSNTAIDFLVYFFLTRYLGFIGDLLFVAKIVSYFVATLNSYLLNRSWTFAKSGSVTWKEFGKFYALMGSGVLINVGVYIVNTRILGMSDLISLFIAAVFTAVWGYALSRTFIFRT